MANRGLPFHRGRLYRPIMVFTLFLVFGLVHGLASGGNRNAALWEIRAMFYLPIGYVLLMNLVDRKDQYRRLYTLILIAVFMNSIIALLHYGTLTEAKKETMESFVAHGATLPMNAMLVLLAASWLFKDGSRAKRIVLPFALVPVVYVYIISERRAAFVALLGAFILLGIVLFWTRPRAFWKVVPVVFLIVAGYTGAFWNNETSAAGFPAQAIKSVVAPDQVSSRNQDSDFYRIIEKNDIVATIRSSPILGIGFGHPFLRPYPLPEINPFLLEPYMPHNAILYMWMKFGAVGFAAMVYMFGIAMHTGSRTILKLPPGDYAAITLTSIAFVMMYAIFAYVDISWDAQNMLILALAMAQLASAPRLAGAGCRPTVDVAPPTPEPDEDPVVEDEPKGLARPPPRVRPGVAAVVLAGPPRLALVVSAGLVGASCRFENPDTRRAGESRRPGDHDDDGCRPILRSTTTDDDGAERRRDTSATTDASTGPQWVSAAANLVGLHSECGNLSIISARPDRDMLIVTRGPAGSLVEPGRRDTWTQLGQGPVRPRSPTGPRPSSTTPCTQTPSGRAASTTAAVSTAPTTTATPSASSATSRTSTAWASTSPTRTGARCSPASTSRPPCCARPTAGRTGPTSQHRCRPASDSSRPVRHRAARVPARHEPRYRRRASTARPTAAPRGPSVYKGAWSATRHDGRRGDRPPRSSTAAGW